MSESVGDTLSNDMTAMTAMTVMDEAMDVAMDVVLELQERGHRMAVALPVHTWPCVIGRSTAAHWVLTDASVAPEQVRLLQGANGEGEVEVLDAINGVWLGRRHYRAGERFVWPAGTRLQLGRDVQLSWRGSQQPVAEAQRWRPVSRWQGPVILFALIALALEMLWATWLGVTEEGGLLRRLAPGLMGTFAVLLVWAIVWSLVSKILTGVVSFWRHVCIASVGLLSWMVVMQLLGVAAFAFSLPILTRFESEISILAAALLLWFHLRVATPASTRLLSIGVAALLVVGLGTKLGLQWSSQKQLGSSLYMTGILPPSWRVVPAKSIDELVLSTDGMREQLDRRAKEDVEEGEQSEESGLD